MKKIHQIYIFLSIFLFISIGPGNGYCEDPLEYQYYPARIIELDEQMEEGVKSYNIKAVFSEGPFENKAISLEYMPVLGTSHDIALRKDMPIIVCLQSKDGHIIYSSFFGVNRKDIITKMTIIFVAILVIIGGFKGIFATISLLATFLLIIFCLIPLMLNGVNPILATILVSSISIFISFILITGFSKKSFCAIISTIGGTIIAGIFAFYFGNLMALTGLSNDSVQTLVTQTDITIDYRGLLFSGMILGTMGAVMDIGMSITSFIFELKTKKPNISSIALFNSGMTVGKDIMSTMTNTLILAYAGSSLPLFLYFAGISNDFTNIVNIEFIAEEILRSISGSIGLILTIPLTSFIAARKAQG